MGTKNSYRGIDDYAAKLCKLKSIQLIGKLGITIDDLPDIEQEIMIEIVTKLPDFDPEKANKKTFIRMLIDRKIADLLQIRKAAKRGYENLILSLNTEFEDDDGNTSEFIDEINQDDYFLRNGKSSRTNLDDLELSFDVVTIVGMLPENLRKICCLLSENTKTETARILGISKKKLYADIEKIEHFFRKHGLEKNFQK